MDLQPYRNAVGKEHALFWYMLDVSPDDAARLHATAFGKAVEEFDPADSLGQRQAAALLMMTPAQFEQMLAIFRVPPADNILERNAPPYWSILSLVGWVAGGCRTWRGEHQQNLHNRLINPGQTNKAAVCERVFDCGNIIPATFITPGKAKRHDHFHHGERRSAGRRVQCPGSVARGRLPRIAKEAH